VGYINNRERSYSVSVGLLINTRKFDVIHPGRLGRKRQHTKHTQTRLHKENIFEWVELTLFVRVRSNDWT